MDKKIFFNGLFESVIEANKELFIAHLGASIAEQLPKYFAMNGVDVIVEILRANNIQLQIAEQWKFSKAKAFAKAHRKSCR